ncbi:putative late blight resistance protein homolog R1A-3 [Coffea arabica]|uniref:Late blight resistance protein homolog R1A-3 n=1 Tax=Coffea arabica TaxID=13443 RepID=A0A6P6SA47_COFAR
MASSCLTSISAVFKDLQFLKNSCPKSPEWMVELFRLTDLEAHLRIFRTFLLCVRKWGDDGDAVLGALVVTMKDAISKQGRLIFNTYNFTVGYTYRIRDLGVVPSGLRSFHPEIKEWYLVSSDWSSRQSSNSQVKKDDLMEIMDSLRENLNDIVYSMHLYNSFREQAEALEEMLTFLKNFICFVTLHGVEDMQLGPLLSQVEFVAVNAASLSFAWFCKESMSIKDDTSDLLQKIIYAEPQVHKTCVQALIASKLSRQPYAETDEHVLRGFINSLIFYLWEIIKTRACLMISLKDQLRLLFEGLISFRTILKENPDKFDEKMRYLIRLVLCDAGLVAFSLSLSAEKDGVLKDMDLVSYQDFLERLKVIKAAVAETCPETSSSNFPRTNELGFIAFLQNYMMELTSSEAGSVALVNYPIQTIQEELIFLHPFLEKIVELRNEDEELQAFWDRVVEVAYKAEFLIDSLLVGDVLDSSSISFDSIVEELKIIKAVAMKIFESNRLDLKVKEVTKSLNHMRPQSSKPIISDVVVGLEDEATLIINRLTRGSSQLQIIPIVGMPGLGKTTLAKKVYNDSSVMSHFYARAWCTVSQTYYKKNLLLQILTSIHTKLHDKFVEMSEEDLAAEVRRGLLRTKYLIVLDDIWDTEAWNALEASFPDNRNGSRVIMTSRNRDLAAPRGELDEGPHFLRPLTPDESWDLLSKRLFPGKDLPPPELCELRMQIVEMCQGLPLTIVILAGILANEDQYSWKRVVEGLNSSMLSSTEQCTAALELSYNNLPDYLKPCFLYFGAFPEDHEHTTERLNWLWVAEGFAQKTQFKSAEDVANDHMMALINRSLVMVSKQRSIGGVKTCRVHDLLYEFCVRKGRQEKFVQLVSGYDELYTISVPHNLRRLCINSNPGHFCKSRLFAPTIRSLLFFNNHESYQPTVTDIPFLVAIKLVKVLDLSQLNLGSTFPRELELLVHLRYLAVVGDLESIASSMSNLLNLETLILETFDSAVSLPDSIWNLKKLRHLVLKGDCLDEYCELQLPTYNLENAEHLCDLNTLSRVMLPSWDTIDKMFRKFPNIHKLKCSFYEANGSRDSADKVLALDFLSGLESLTLKFINHTGVQCQFEFQFPLTIRKLTLSGFLFPWSKISEIQNLPNLAVLKLLDGAFQGKIWNMEEEEEGFPKVSFLKIASLDIVNWTASEYMDCFPSLRKLVLEDCHFLEEIPSGLGSSTLETIEASDCPFSASFIQPLQEEQMDMGNTDLKIHISSSKMNY